MTNLFIRPVLRNMDTYGHVEVNNRCGNLGPILAGRCDESDYSYNDLIYAGWDSKVQNLWIIEHDIFPTEGQIEELEACPYLLCVPLYYSEPSHTGLSKKVIVHRKYDMGGKLQWISANEEWADIVGIGMIKIHKLIRQTAELYRGNHWKHMDVYISELIRSSIGLQFHVHSTWVKHVQS
jgi:hypothetical protein